MSEQIDHTNYEAWLLDRLEGNLSPEQEAALDAFLAANPGIAPIGHDLPSIGATDLPAFNKDLLKRNLPPQGKVTEASIDDHLVARLEGDLSPEQLLALEKFLYEHPEYAKTDRLYALTKLVPQAMEFAAKKELERMLPPQGFVTKFTLQDHLIARLEGDLTREQAKALDTFLAQNASAPKEWALVSRTRIMADRITFPGRSELKKGGRILSIGAARPVMRYAAAASIALLLSFWIWLALRPTMENRLVNVDATGRIEQKQVNTGTSPHSDPIGANDRKEEKLPATIEEIAPEAADAAVKRTDPSTDRAKGISPESAKKKPAPIGTPIDREKLQFAEQRKVVPAFERPEAGPIAVEVAEVPVELDREPPAERQLQEERGNSIGTLVASAVREKVLNSPSEENRPLDRSDAVAAVDKGLKAISGEKAGLDVQRTKGGKIRNFNLRVGEFALTASTGN